MQQKILLLRASDYSVTENGKTNAGVSVQYCTAGAPVNEPDRKGWDTIKQSLPVGSMASVEAVPGWYEMSFTVGTVRDSQGRTVPALKPSGLRFIAPLDGSPLAEVKK